MIIRSPTRAGRVGRQRRGVDDLSRLRAGAAAEEEGHLQGRLRPDRKQQSVAPGADRQHEGRSREARLPARLHRRRQLGRQAGRRRQQHDRPGRRLHLPRPARREAADPRRHGRQEGRHPGAADRPQRRPVARQGAARTISPSSARTSSRKASASPNGRSAKTGGKGKIIELEGTIGASPANDRKKGFDDAIKAKAPGHGDRRQPVGRFRPRQGPAGRRDAAAGASRRHHRLRPQRRNGARRHRGDRGGRQGSGQGHSRRLDRRREGRASRRSSTARWARPANAARASGPRPSTSCTPTPPAKRSRRSIINPDRFFDATNAKEMLPTAF